MKSLQRGQFFLFRAKDIHSKGLLHHIDFPSDDEFDVSVSLVIVRRQSKKLSVPDGYVRFVNKDTSLSMAVTASLYCLYVSFVLNSFPANMSLSLPISR